MRSHPMRRRRATTVLMSLTLLACVVYSHPAVAHVFSADTSIRARMVPSGTVTKGERVLVFGRLRSGQAVCRQGKTVQLMRRRPGADTVLRSDTTDAEGEYRFRIKARKDMTVYVAFRGSVESSYGHSHTCRGSSSRGLQVNVSSPTRDGGGGGGGGTSDPSCHPSYPDFCIPPPPPDLDCDDVNGSNFTVVGTDPHGFDGEGDGRGCES